MSPENEAWLWQRVPEAGAMVDGAPKVRQAVDEMLRTGRIASRKQALRTLEKWRDKGVYEYGVNIELGWRRVTPGVKG